MVERLPEQEGKERERTEYRVSWIFRVYRERGRLKSDAVFIGGGTGIVGERGVRLEVAKEDPEVQDVQGETGCGIGLQLVGKEWRIQHQDRKFTAGELDLMWREFAAVKALHLRKRFHRGSPSAKTS